MNMNGEKSVKNCYANWVFRITKSEGFQACKASPAIGTIEIIVLKLQNDFKALTLAEIWSKSWGQFSTSTSTLS